MWEVRIPERCKMQHERFQLQNAADTMQYKLQSVATTMRTINTMSKRANTMSDKRVYLQNLAWQIWVSLSIKTLHKYLLPSSAFLQQTAYKTSLQPDASAAPLP